MIARRMGAKYSTKLGDERLGADRWDEVAELLRGLNWERWCLEASELASGLVRARQAVVDRADAAGERARALSEARVGALRGRNRVVHDVDAMLAWEERCADELPHVIGRPRLVLDSMGFVVLAGHRREQPA
jgi:hypothetical protein